MSEEYEDGNGIPQSVIDQAEPSVPEGWKLVPISPTTDQLKAMAFCESDCPWIVLYNAAINAAPQPPENLND